MTQWIFICFLLCGCMSFPYQGVIEESTRYLEDAHPQSFKSFQWQDKTIHYVSMGDRTKPLVVLIHGSPGSWKSYANFFKKEAFLKNFQVVTFDRLGYGQHQKGTPYGQLKDQATVPMAIIETLNPQSKRPVILVGHSYGGPLAVQMAMNHPQKINGVVLAAAALDPELEEVKWYQTVAEWLLIRWMIPSDLNVCNREILSLKAELQKMEENYQHLKQPFYVIQGDIDQLVPKENVDYLKEKMKLADIHYKVIPQARHFLPWSFPSSIIEGIDHINSKLKGL